MTNVIEKNVSPESLAESKRSLAHLVEAAGRCTARALGRPFEASTELAVGVFTLLLGLTVAFGGPQAGPNAAELEESASAEQTLETFLRLGRWLIAGSKARTLSMP
ncbi:MAG: hypothetical protein SFW67_33675 [Myxococcaceae bacterium]|nr:hypothetical protein [Myxococcaceae bacterium]